MIIYYLISNPLDELYSKTIEYNHREDFSPLFMDGKGSIMKYHDDPKCKLYCTNDHMTGITDGKTNYSFNPFADSHLDKIVCPIFKAIPGTVGYTNQAIAFDTLKLIYKEDGLDGLIRAINYNSVFYYEVKFPRYPNELTVCRDPFEFLLIQLGLNRIDIVPYESDHYNITYNSELYSRYCNDKNIIIDELYTISR